MKHPKLTSLAFAALAACAMSVHAEDGSAVTISGFGTGALTGTNTDNAEYARPNQAAGVKKNPGFGVDSNFGIQVSDKWSDTISFTAQGLVRKNGSNNAFTGELAWAFAKYKFNDDFSFRVGRIGLPIYMISDFRNVGYANTMLRPPDEVYRQVSLDNVDGADVVYQHSFDDTTLTAQFAAGHGKVDSPGPYEVQYHPVTALNVVVENGPFSFRLGRADAHFTVENYASLTTLVATVKTYGIGALAPDLTIDDVKGSFTSLGMTMDYKNFLIQSEYAKRKTESRLVPDTTSWYAMFGYRIGKFTPYYNYATVKQDSITSYATLPTAGPLAPLTAAIDGAITTGLRSTNTLGVRWDFYKSAALKVQFDRVKLKDGTAGSFLNPTPSFTGPVNVYAAAIDFVF